VLGLGLLTTLPAAAQSWPSRPVRMVIPYPAGGSVDFSGRRLIEDLAAELGQSITVDNRGGANGIIGTEVVAKTGPDGYTFLASTLSAHDGNPAAVKVLPYHPIEDFAPVTVINAVPLLLAAPERSEGILIEVALDPEVITTRATLSAITRTALQSGS